MGLQETDDRSERAQHKLSTCFSSSHSQREIKWILSSSPLNELILVQFLFLQITIIFIRLKVLLRRFSFYRELGSHGTSSKVVLKARKFIKHILAKNLLNFGFHHFKHMEFFIQDTDITRPRRPKVCLVYCLTSFEINIHG